MNTLKNENVPANATFTASYDYAMTFTDASQKRVACLRWKGGVLELEGDADESARIFAVCLGNHLSRKLQDYEAALMDLRRHDRASEVLAKWRPQP